MTLPSDWSKLIPKKCLHFPRSFYLKSFDKHCFYTFKPIVVAGQLEFQRFIGSKDLAETLRSSSAKARMVAQAGVCQSYSEVPQMQAWPIKWVMVKTPQPPSVAKVLGCRENNREQFIRKVLQDSVPFGTTDPKFWTIGRKGGWSWSGESDYRG